MLTIHIQGKDSTLSNNHQQTLKPLSWVFMKIQELKEKIISTKHVLGVEKIEVTNLAFR